MSLTELIYIGAGCLLPMFYAPQIKRCLQDDSGLASYSLKKAAIQLGLRLLMLPFIWAMGNTTMNLIVSLDLLGRGAELVAAVASLRLQGASWRAVTARVVPWNRFETISH